MITVTAKQLSKYGKPLVHFALLVPLVWLVYGWWQAFQGLPNWLGFNPNEMSNRATGDWALRVLLLSLAVTPLGLIFNTKKLIVFRRMLGVWAFAYVCVHITSYVWLDMLLDWTELWKDVLKRIYITVGMTAFILLIPLVMTSTAKSVRRVGAANWKKLHKSVYFIGVLAVIHFFMMRKGLQLEPLVYGAILLALFAVRLKEKVRKGRLARA